MKKLFFALLLLSASWTAAAECPYDYVGGVPAVHINGVWLPQSEIFAPLIADPRMVTNSGGLRFNDNVIGKYVGACSFGSQFGIFRWNNFMRSCGLMQFDIEAGIFSVFDLKHADASMVNTDFFVAGMLTYAKNCWSYRFRLWHQSCHLGDEFLAANPGYDRRNVSDEAVDFFASYQFCPPIRAYGGIGYIFDRDRTFSEHPLFFEWGAEAKVFGFVDGYNRVVIQPFLAIHFRSWEEHDFDIDQTYALGMEWSHIQGTGRNVRIFAQYHDGFSREGQFIRQRSNYLELRLTYGF